MTSAILTLILILTPSLKGLGDLGFHWPLSHYFALNTMYASKDFSTWVLWTLCICFDVHFEISEHIYYIVYMISYAAKHTNHPSAYSIQGHREAGAHLICHRKGDRTTWTGCQSTTGLARWCRQPNHVFGLCKKAGMPGENPYRHRKDPNTPFKSKCTSKNAIIVCSTTRKVLNHHGWTQRQLQDFSLGQL